MICEVRIYRYINWVLKRQKHSLDHRESQGIQEKYLLHWLHWSLVWIKTNWKIFKEIRIPEHLPVFWETCMQVKKQQLGPYIEELTGLKLQKEYFKAVYCHSTYLTSMQRISCEMLCWMNHKLKSRFPGEISTHTDMEKNHSNGRKWRGTEEPLEEGEKGKWKSCLETQH